MATHTTPPPEAQAPASAPTAKGRKSKKASRDRLSAWYFPDFEGPDLSEELVEGQHESLKVLDSKTIAEVFADQDDEDEDGDGDGESADDPSFSEVDAGADKGTNRDRESPEPPGPSL